MRVASDARTPGQGKVATFYSYKGGLGRTLALAGTALELASRHAKKVLAIDWDLETPDLHTAFGCGDGWATGRSGLLDYLEAGQAEFQFLQDHQAEAGGRQSVHLRDFVEAVPAAGSGDGGVDLMSAGDLGPGYLRRLHRLDWQDLYANRGGFWIMERLRLQATESYDVVLIDARAGRSGASYVPLLQLSDLAVIVFAANGSSDAGTIATMSALANHRRANRQPPMVMLVPSLLLSDTTNAAQAKGMSAVTTRLGEIAAHVPDFASDPWLFALPFDERVAAGHRVGRNAPPEDGSELSLAYRRIADALAMLPPPP